MIAATPLRANSRSICTYATTRNPPFLNPFLSAHTKLPRICTFHSYFKSRRFCTYARTHANSFRFCSCKTGTVPPLRRQLRGFSAVTHFASRLNPSARFSFALLRVSAPWREAPRFAFDSALAKPKIYPVDLQDLRNSISRNSYIPKRLEIPGGGGYANF